VPVALLSLIDRERQWFKSCAGIDIKETSREAALCAHTIMSDDPLVVLDTTQDLRFADNPVVAAPPHVRFYAGAPLITREGMRVGTICLIHFVPRDSFGDELKKALADFTALAMEAMELRQALLNAGGQEAESAFPAARVTHAGEAAKRQFLAVVGHELRTPLNAILGFGALLRNVGTVPECPAHHDYVEAIFSSGKRLLSTVDAVLSYAQAERGELQLREEPLDLAELAATCILACQGEAVPKNVRVHAPLTDPMRPLLLADRIHTEQMLIQLLSNAVAFTPQGGEVSVRLVTTEDGGQSIAVDDAGPGMGDDEVTRAMEIFRQLSEGLARKKEGMGISLLLTKLLVELHGGSLDLSPRSGPGTTATLSFPAWRTRPSRAA